MSTEIQYQTSTSGTSYSIHTDPKIIAILENCRVLKHRIRLVYGNTDTGKSWEERHEVEGRIGRSTGSIKIPILVYNSRSWGGGDILDSCIIGIRLTTSKEWLYKHPKGSFDLKGMNINQTGAYKVMKRMSYDTYYKMILNTMHNKNYSSEKVRGLIDDAIMLGDCKRGGMDLTAFLTRVKPVQTMLNNRR